MLVSCTTLAACFKVGAVFAAERRALGPRGQFLARSYIFRAPPRYRCLAELSRCCIGSWQAAGARSLTGASAGIAEYIGLWTQCAVARSAASHMRQRS